MTRATLLAVAAPALLLAACTLSGTASAPTYVCAAEDAAGARITCAAAPDTYPGEGCRCVTRATGARGPDAFYGRVAAE